MDWRHHCAKCKNEFKRCPNEVWCSYSYHEYEPCLDLCEDCTEDLKYVIDAWLEGKPLKRNIGLYGDH